MHLRAFLGGMAVLLAGAGNGSAGDPQWVVYDGFAGPGAGKHIVLIAGDDEYRAEEAMPQLGKILAARHGFKCTVLFTINADGEIDPKVANNIPGLAALDSADLMILFTRFRNLPPEQMAKIEGFLQAGKPVIGIRTSTHAFNIGDKKHPYHKWTWTYNGSDFAKGFGGQILGETWVAHHGGHGSEATRGILVPEQRSNPILNGINDGDIFGPTDVYRVNLPLPGDSTPLVLGQVVKGMKPTDPPVEGDKNNPMMPIVWTKSYQLEGGVKGTALTTTFGSSQDLSSEGYRRLLVNASYALTKLPVPAKADVALVGDYQPTPFRAGGHTKGVKPADHALAAGQN